MEIQHVDQFSDGRSAMLKQVEREHASQFVAAQTSRGHLGRHGRTMSPHADIHLTAMRLAATRHVAAASGLPSSSTAEDLGIEHGVDMSVCA
jgi:hypothetical protein